VQLLPFLLLLVIPFITSICSCPCSCCCWHPCFCRCFLFVVGPTITGVHDLALLHNVACIHAVVASSAVVRPTVTCVYDPFSCKCFCCRWLFCCWRCCMMNIAAGSPCCCFFPAPIPEKSSGLFGFLEGDLLHSQMPGKFSGPQSGTFYIPGARPCRSSSRGQTFMAWRHVKCLIPGTGRLFWHLEMQKIFLQGSEEFSDMGECEKDLWVEGKMS
jgi:hypothetical protein